MNGTSKPFPRNLYWKYQSGVALVLVLWMLALLTVIANSTAFSVRTEFSTAANLTALAEAEAIADAGVYKAIHELLLPSSTPLRWQGNGLPHMWEFNDATVQITIRDESGKIDINAAPLPILLGLLRALETPDTEANSVAEAIMDWRDPDDAKMLNGAEREDYLAQGKTYGPANASFQSIDELRLVLGVNESLFRSMERFVTVYSRRTTANAAVAPRQVLLSFPGATPEMVDDYISRRDFLLQRNLPPPPFPVAGGATDIVSFFSIEVDALLRDNTRFSRVAVVRLTGKISEPYVILSWRIPRHDNGPQPFPTPSDRHG